MTHQLSQVPPAPRVPWHLDIPWAVQIFETPAVDQAPILAAMQERFGDDVVTLASSSAREHFVIVESADDPALVGAIEQLVTRMSDAARRVHLSDASRITDDIAS